ncbi:MAG TPA: ATP-binding protein [Geobacteraceae bacterium]
MQKSSPFPRMVLLGAAIVGISLLHYLTPLHRPLLHDIFQRLYYLPIILAAFWFGLQGGLGAAVVVSILYAPHILFQWGAHPSLELEKFLEIVLYNIVGGITGFLSQQGEQRREDLARTAQRLEDSYHKLQQQADLVIGIEEQLRRAERLSALGELSAVLAHEIRNPLGSIKGTAEILRDDFQPGDRKYEFLEILTREADRLNRVVEDFLGLARPVPAERASFDLATEMAETAALIASEADQRRVRIILRVDGLPLLRGDREKLRQVFLNLMQNGIQAMASGGELTVTATALAADERQPAGIGIAIADQGSGIPPENLERLFDPFFTTKAGGTGLGLAIAQKIVESHNGRITVVSDPGQGATFRVWLPL